jgi:hypothetical protein
MCVHSCLFLLFVASVLKSSQTLESGKDSISVTYGYIINKYEDHKFKIVSVRDHVCLENIIYKLNNSNQTELLALKDGSKLVYIFVNSSGNSEELLIKVFF